MREKRLVPPPVEEPKTDLVEEPDFSDPKELERHRKEQAEELEIKKALEKEIDRLGLFNSPQPKDSQ